MAKKRMPNANNILQVTLITRLIFYEINEPLKAQ